jgi:hypothetical protein
VLCASAWPFVKAARRLLAEGYPANATIEMWRPDTHEWAMRGRLGAVAETLIDGETASRCAKNGSPARDLEQRTGKGLPLVCARPRVVSGVDSTPQRNKHCRQCTTARTATRKRLEHRRKTRPRR